MSIWHWSQRKAADGSGPFKRPTQESLFTALAPQVGMPDPEALRVKMADHVGDENNRGGKEVEPLKEQWLSITRGGTLPGVKVPFWEKDKNGQKGKGKGKEVKKGK